MAMRRRTSTSHEGLELALARRLDERLTPRDLKLLEDCWMRQDVELVCGGKLTVHQSGWLVYHQLLAIWVDKLDRVWIETTQTGRDLVRHIKKRGQCATTSAPRS
jgi:hypothetical protein